MRRADDFAVKMDIRDKSYLAGGSDRKRAAANPYHERAVLSAVGVFE